MAAQLNLAAAAGAAFDNLQIWWGTNNLKSRLQLFWTSILPTFVDADVPSRPVSNWITVLAALTSQLAATNVPIGQLTESADVVYRLCWMAQALKDMGQITPTQASSLLAFYNTYLNV